MQLTHKTDVVDKVRIFHELSAVKQIALGRQRKDGQMGRFEKLDSILKGFFHLPQVSA